MAVVDTSIQKESQDRYLTYALSVVSSRALPDVRDGLKPVQRRILYAMLKDGLHPGHKHSKCAGVVGEVLKHFHPHGDSAVYDALVRMAQDFSLRYPLIDGQGNFGSLDGDNAAAYRYTEARLREFAIEVIGEIEEETVGFRDNFDATTLEPIVLPARVPNLLVNGAAGIAVGMATSFPPHNLRDVIKALLEVCENPDVTNSRLTTIVKGPDFPGGGLILNSRAELVSIYETGKGTVRVRGEWTAEDGPRGKRFAVISSIPYAVNKSQLVEKIGSLISERKVPQLTDVRDESTDQVRIVLELASGAEAEVAMAYLFRHTPLETNFSVNMTALVPTGSGNTVKPQVLSLRDCLQHFLTFREEVTRRRLTFEKKNLENRIHILQGLLKICDNLDEAIRIVRKSEGRSDAAARLKTRFKLSDEQALAVVDMRIYQLSRTSIDEIRRELADKEKRAAEIQKILKSAAKVRELVREDLERAADKFGDKRKSRFASEDEEIQFDASAYVVQEDVYAIVSRDGWIKRIRQNNEIGSTRMREGDAISRAHALSTTDYVAFFTNLGNLFVLRVSDFPSSGGYGDPIQKILKFKDGELIVDSFGVKAQSENLLPLGDLNRHYLKDGDQVLLVTARGTGFALKLEGLQSPRKVGRRAIKLRQGDALVSATALRKHVALFSRSACGLVISAKEVPLHESAAVGVSLMGVRKDDSLVGASSFDKPLTFRITTTSDSVKEVESSEIVSGHRGLKGNKVIARGEIARIETGADASSRKE